MLSKWKLEACQILAFGSQLSSPGQADALCTYLLGPVRSKTLSQDPAKHPSLYNVLESSWGKKKGGKGGTRHIKKEKKVC